ncbi:GNAT family N-acetyltransferase [Streptomyces sp. NBC_01361]|uniref:GNAT family N-acetyltransferase n=1 Tax=Streptomyces sp. NBC_01361 TaxID=2903838 RepID=UPI002E375BEA|nr:GNAT family N-acetyltransferase [Streptomyces sp. NBC_01361]
MRPGGGDLSAEVCTDGVRFGSLGPQWEALYRRSRTATPFQSHAWLHSWWLSYGSGRGLCVVLVRDGGRLVAAAPLMRRWRPLPVLVPLGGSISDFCDVLVDDDGDGEGGRVRALGDALWRLARTHVIDFREARPGSAVEGLYDRWPGPRRRLDDSLCLELPPVPMDDIVGRLPRARAQRARAKVRKLDALGIERRVVPPDQTDGSVRRLVELHRLQWEGRKVTTEHLRPRFSEHLTRSVSLMARSGDAVVTEFRIDETVLAADLTFLSPCLTGGYLYGAHPGLRERKADVATMLLRSCSEHVQERASGSLSLLRGDEPYKHHWRPHSVVNQRFVLARPGTSAGLALAVGDVTARRLGKRALQAWKARGGDASS